MLMIQAPGFDKRVQSHRSEPFRGGFNIVCTPGSAERESWDARLVLEADGARLASLSLGSTCHSALVTGRCTFAMA